MDKAEVMDENVNCSKVTGAALLRLGPLVICICPARGLDGALHLLQLMGFFGCCQ